MNNASDTDPDDLSPTTPAHCAKPEPHEDYSDGVGLHAGDPWCGIYQYLDMLSDYLSHRHKDAISRF